MFSIAESSGMSCPNWKTKPNSVPRSRLALRRPGRPIGRPSNVDLAPGRAGDPRQAVQERRLARAARAHDGDDLAGGQPEVDPPQGGRLSEFLVDGARFEQGRSGGGHRSRDAAWSGRARHEAHAGGTSGRARRLRRSSSTRAAVRSSQRRSASRWKSSLSASRATGSDAVRRRAVSSRIRSRWAWRSVSTSGSTGRPERIRDDDLREQRDLDLRLGIERPVEPALQLLPARPR